MTEKRGVGATLGTTGLNELYVKTSSPLDWNFKVQSRLWCLHSTVRTQNPRTWIEVVKHQSISVATSHLDSRRENNMARTGVYCIQLILMMQKNKSILYSVCMWTFSVLLGPLLQFFLAWESIWQSYYTEYQDPNVLYMWHFNLPNIRINLWLLTFISLVMAEKIIQKTVFANWNLSRKIGPCFRLREI